MCVLPRKTELVHVNWVLQRAAARKRCVDHHAMQARYGEEMAGAERCVIPMVLHGAGRFTYKKWVIFRVNEGKYSMEHFGTWNFRGIMKIDELFPLVG